MNLTASGHIAERTNLRYFLTVGMCSSGLFTALFGLGRYWHIHSLSFYIGVQVNLTSTSIYFAWLFCRSVSSALGWHQQGHAAEKNSVGAPTKPKIYRG